MPPTNTPQPAPPQATSGGLALDAPAWERLYGKGPTSNANASYKKFGKNLPDTAVGTYEYAVTFDISGDRRATLIDRNWGTAVVPMEQARAEGARLGPSDAQLVRTFVSDQTGNRGKTVDLYYSEWLKGQFPAEKWQFHRVEPGTFAVVYSLNTERAVDSRNGRPYDARIIVGLGDNP